MDKKIFLKTSLIAILFPIMCLVSLNTVKSFTEEYKQRIKVNEIKEITREVELSNDEVLEKILENAKYKESAYKILEKKELYPRELLELASKNQEAIDFVADYLNRKEDTVETSVVKGYKEGEIPLFLQWDKKWGYDKYGSNYIALNGCGPTSLAMVIVGLTGNTEINPKIIADYSYENGYLVEGVGSKWSLMSEGAKEFGVKSSQIPIKEETIIKALKNGQPIIATMKPGDFTDTGHYIVLTGIDENNKITVNDPNSIIKSNKTWDVQVFLEQAKNLWAFECI